MTEPVVATFDLSKRRTGWAVLWPSMPKPAFGVIEPDGKSGGAVLADLWDLAVSKHERFHLTHIVIEQVFVNTKDFQFAGTEAQFQMRGVLSLFAHRHGIRVMQAPIGAWRKEVFGTAKAPEELGKNRKHTTDYWKNLAVKACAERSWYVTHHDEADAICIGLYALSCLDERFAARQGPLFRRAELDHDHRRGAHA